jgi:hypothetical protein
VPLVATITCDVVAGESGKRSAFEDEEAEVAADYAAKRRKQGEYADDEPGSAVLLIDRRLVTRSCQCAISLFCVCSFNVVCAFIYLNDICGVLVVFSGRRREQERLLLLRGRIGQR